MINSVIDVSHHNGQINWRDVATSDIIGVIHKATQGTTGSDQTFRSNRTQAKDAGLLFGAYHFATGSDGVQQADHFLDVVKPDEKTLLVLDLEDNPQGPSMPLSEAHAFVERIFQVTGRYPGLYSGHYIKRLLGNNPDPVLAQCWFWLAQYGPAAIVPAAWKTWTMWQYTDGSIGSEPHTVPGVGRCDRDKFNGDLDGLRRLWGATV